MDLNQFVSRNICIERINTSFLLSTLTFILMLGTTTICLGYLIENNIKFHHSPLYFITFFIAIHFTALIEKTKHRNGAINESRKRELIIPHYKTESLANTKLIGAYKVIKSKRAPILIEFLLSASVVGIGNYYMFLGSDGDNLVENGILMMIFCTACYYIKGNSYQRGLFCVLMMARAQTSDVFNVHYERFINYVGDYFGEIENG